MRFRLSTLNRITRLLIAALVLTHAGAAAAQSPASGRDLSTATIEDLMNITVTSAARKAQSAEDVPAAVYVITQNDIRRSGLTTLPELLRLVPGVQVAQVNANKWAVSIRGFNDLYSNKLLVLVDGRSVYSRTFSGVFWDIQDLMVSDIERIEVVRGPRGAVWGANAVNGVINVITRPAADTQGFSGHVSAGSFDRERVGVRYGGTIGGAAYRAFSQWSRKGDGAEADPSGFEDGWHSLTNGFRIDGSRGANALMAQGHFTTNLTRPGWLVLPDLNPGVTPVTDGVSHAHETSVLGRWTRTRSDGTAIQLQGYYTATRRREAIVEFSEHTSDLDGQYETRLGAKHGLMLGAGYRQVDLSTVDTLTVHLGGGRARTLQTFFLDEISLRRDLALTLGSRFEYDSLAGWGLLPSARLMWEVTPSQRAWAAVSRARRTPSFAEHDVRFSLGVLPGPGLPIVYGYTSNPSFRSEHLLQAELGYRVRLGSTASIDVTAFSGSHQGLSVSQPLEPIVQQTPAPVHLFAGNTLMNLLSVRTNGAEIDARWMPTPSWQLEASYSLLDLSSHVDAPKLIAPARPFDGNAPKHQGQVRSTIALRPGVQATASVFRVARLRELGVPAYTRVDAGLEFRLNSRLTAAFAGQNLLTAQRPEFSSPQLFLSSTMPRRVRIDLRWQL